MADLPLIHDASTDARRQQWLGTIQVAPRLSHTLLTAGVSAAVLALAALCALGWYTRTTHVAGWLVPEDGLVRVTAPQPGEITEVLVRDGDRVEAGARLFVLTTDAQDTTASGPAHDRAQQLWTQRAALQASAFRRRTQLALETGAVRRRLRTARASLAATGRSATRRARRVSLQREIELLTARLASVPQRAASDLARIERETAAVDQQLAELAGGQPRIVTAPWGGIVSMLVAARGVHAAPGAPMLRLARPGVPLEAHLFTSMRAVVALRPGERVRLRFPDFPEPTTGRPAGALLDTPAPVADPRDVPPPLADAAGSTEPVYRLVVRPDSQTIRALGRQIALRPGMPLDAEVVLERRRVIDWLFDPLTTRSRARTP